MNERKKEVIRKREKRKKMRTREQKGERKLSNLLNYFLNYIYVLYIHILSMSNFYYFVIFIYKNLSTF